MRVNTVVLIGGFLGVALAAAVPANAAASRAAAPRPAAAATSKEQPQTLAAWRADTEAKLKAPDGWLTVAGLFFLNPGANSVGSDPKSAVVLPADAAPAKVGTIVVDGEKAFFEPEPGADVKIQGQPVKARVELTGVVVKEGELPTRLTVGRLTLHLHHSGPRLAVRLRDPESQLRREFTGVKWFAPSSKWIVKGHYVAFDTPKTYTTQNVLGDAQRLKTPGEVEITVDGQTIKLLAAEENGKLWFIFSDATSPKETYRIRFLKAEPPPEGAKEATVTLDFNRTYNPPCAYNQFTTCPLPPPQNKLKIRVPAGERGYHHATESAATH